MTLGIAAFIPGLLPPQEPKLLLAGAFAICVSIYQLLPRRKKRSFLEKDATRLLDKLFSFTDKTMLRAVFEEGTFTEDAFTLEDISSGQATNRYTVPLSNVECVAETKDLYLLIFNKNRKENGIILPKSCFIGETSKQFHSFLTSKDKLIPLEAPASS